MTTTVAVNAREILRSSTVSEGCTAINHVRQAIPALQSVHVACEIFVSGTELLRRYNEWGPLGLDAIANAAQLLGRVGKNVGQIRFQADASAVQLKGIWPDTAGKAAYENYKTASTRADTDIGQINRCADALQQYHHIVTSQITQLKDTAELILGSLVRNLGGLSTTSAIVALVQRINTLTTQTPAPENAQAEVDALRSQLSNQVALPTEFAVGHLNTLLNKTTQDLLAATDVLVRSFDNISTSPYAVPEFPIGCTPEGNECGCADTVTFNTGLTSADPGIPVTPVPASGGGGSSAGGPSGSGGSGGGSGSSDVGSGTAPQGDSHSDKEASEEETPAAVPYYDAAEEEDSGGDSTSPLDISFLGAIAGALGDIISGLENAAGGVAAGFESMLGEGLGTIGDALSGTDLSGFATNAAAPAEAAEEYEDPELDEDLAGVAGVDTPEDTHLTGDINGGALVDPGATAGDIPVTGELAPAASVGLPDAVGVLPLGGAVIGGGVGPGAGIVGGGVVPDAGLGVGGAGGVLPGGGIGVGGGVGSAPHGSHGDFEVESNEIQIPVPLEEPVTQVCTVPATTPMSSRPSTIPGF